MRQAFPITPSTFAGAVRRGFESAQVVVADVERDGSGGLYLLSLKFPSDENIGCRVSLCGVPSLKATAKLKVASVDRPEGNHRGWANGAKFGEPARIRGRFELAQRVVIAE